MADPASLSCSKCTSRGGSLHRSARRGSLDVTRVHLVHRINSPFCGWSLPCGRLHLTLNFATAMASSVLAEGLFQVGDDAVLVVPLVID